MVGLRGATEWWLSVLDDESILAAKRMGYITAEKSVGVEMGVTSGRMVLRGEYVHGCSAALLVSLRNRRRGR
jgi:hypothetical protein